ncbi:MAG: AAA family ATPase [Xanthomonadales bacterium]|nr:AAA family ATPase [Xanthomonadales bacterium]
MSRRKPHHGISGSPFLVHVGLHADRITDADRHPFNVPAIVRGLPLRLKTPVTMLVGENGAGKSTLLEAIAWACGFNARGGDRDQSFGEDADGQAAGRALQLAWRQRVSDGFFLRAETFHQWIDYMESVGATFSQYEHKSLHERSHGDGEAFLALFEGRFEDGVYLLDEPEAALSPERQLAFLALLHQMDRSRCAQFIIATHSPILLCYPGATVLKVDEQGIREIDARESEHVRLTRDFLNAPERYFRHLFADDEST